MRYLPGAVPSVVVQCISDTSFIDTSVQWVRHRRKSVTHKQLGALRPPF